ncbi:MAG: hypothetical protein OXN17_18690 [Candidatus Poribacteria bacterium]|nr:hypothetical protein [Candidatus Poribacteria bacterium]MDE0504726.1 hypothetical protein [Candidatus Poribacteria bacterium]
MKELALGASTGDYGTRRQPFCDAVNAGGVFRAGLKTYFQQLRFLETDSCMSIPFNSQISA